MLVGVAPNDRLLVRLIVSDVLDTPGADWVYGTVISTGDQLRPAFAFSAAQDVPGTAPWVTAPQV